MAIDTETLPLTPESVKAALAVIEPYIHRTPLLTSQTLDKIIGNPINSKSSTAAPKVRVHLKCENFQKIGAFKARGAHHALIRLVERLGIEQLREKGVVTHSSGSARAGGELYLVKAFQTKTCSVLIGNHAQALALAARTFDIPSYIVMPKISTPSKIKGTQAYSDNVLFSGSTSQEREAVVQEVIQKTGAILIPPYDHEDIMLGQGTCALEMEEQFQEAEGGLGNPKKSLDLVLSPLGGGGLLSGICIYFSDNATTRVFGCEPSYQGCDDGKRGLEANPPSRITSVKSLTIADGLRTPVGRIPWKVFTSGSTTKPKYLEGVRSVTDDQIKQAMRLLLERVKIVVEPSSCVGLAALLFDEEFREWIVREQGEDTWDVGLVLTGGNTTIDAIIVMFQEEVEDESKERQEGKVAMDGSRKVENVAG